MTINLSRVFSTAKMSKATRVLPVDPLKIGRIVLSESSDLPLDRWALHLSNDSQDAAYLREAANELRNSDIPVAFPTETVYGLGADATRSSAVKGIYAAKQRPSDNPLIVHISSLQQLRGLLLPKEKVNMRIANGDSRPTVTDGDSTAGSLNRAHHDSELADPIPAIYKPLIQKFWPGPLTLIMPKPENSVLAPEVTAGLNTFGARMPRNLLALALIKLADVPVAAPSANASTKPSPTAAEHVKHDLDGRIDIILDGGPCDVGVESTVVDGLSNPPSILRPGGISIDQLRQCPGWERTVIGYKNASEQGMQPKAPGMKYRHYSPKAKVILYESGTQRPSLHDMLERLSNADAIGIIQTRSWGRSSAAHGIGETTTPGVEEQIKENGVPPLRVQVDTERNYETRMANNPSSPSASSKERPLSHSPSSSTQRLSSSVPPRNMPKHHVTVEERLNMIRGPFGMSREELLEYRKSMGRDSRTLIAYLHHCSTYMLTP